MADGKKSLSADVELRIAAIETLILKGTSRAAIIQYATKEKWDVSDRQVDAYIKRAKANIKRRIDKNRDYQYALAIQRLNMLLQASFTIQDYKACLAVQKELNALLGLYPATEIKIDDWHSQAIADIRDGKLTYEALADAFDDTLAAQLFAKAGVAVSAREG